MSGWVEVGIMAIGLGVQIIIAIITVTWAAGRVTRGLEQSAEEKDKALRRELRDEYEELSHRLGEVGSALRTKITEVEFHVRDHYVSNSVLDKILEMFGENMNIQFKAMQDGLKDIKDRLDRERP